MAQNFSYAEISGQPLAKLRQKIAAAFRQKSIARSIIELTEEIESHVQDSPEHLALFRAEKKKALDFIANWSKEPELEAPKLNTPELQLLWGTILAAQSYKWFDKEKPLTEGQLWKAIAEQELLEDELNLSSQIMSIIPGLRDRQGLMKVEWGMPLKAQGDYPAVGYYCDPQTNTVNLDMLWMLITGIESSRSIMLREAANGLGTLYFTDSMQVIRNEMMALKRLPQRTEEEHERMIRLAAQWLARYDLTTAAESNYANRFAAERTKVSAQHYAASLNYAETVLGDIPAAAAVAALPMTGTIPDRLKMDNLLRAVHFAFFKNNGFFENDAAGWRSMGVRPEWIATSDGAKQGMEALSELLSLCHEMERLQPDANDRQLGDAYYARQMEACSVERCKMADKIFDRFAAQLMPGLEQDALNDPDSVLDRIGDMSGGQEQEDSEPGQEGGEGGAPKDQDVADVKDKGKKRDSRVPPEDPRKAKGLKDEQEGQEPGDEDAPGEEGEGEPGEGEGEPGDGEGEPGEGEGEEGDGEEKEGKLENDDALSEEELKKLKEALEGEGGDGPGESMSDDKPALENDGSYNDYLGIIAPHHNLIRKAVAVMKRIQEKLDINVQDPSIRNSLVPEDGDVDRFQVDALQNRLIKQFSAQAIDESDFEAFRVDGPLRTIHPPTEIHILIDGSGSMSGAPIDTAITTGCVLYEAARLVGMDVYITMLGAPIPLPIAKPGQNNKEIGRNIESVREGLGGNEDFLAAAVAGMVRATLDKKKDLSQPVGNTHTFVITDGGFTDGQVAIDHVKSVHDATRHATVDFVMIGGHGITSIEKLVDEMRKKDGSKATLGYTQVDSPSEIPDGVMELLNNRAKSLRQGEAIPLAQKQKEFRGVKLKKSYTNRF